MHVTFLLTLTFLPTSFQPSSSFIHLSRVMNLNSMKLSQYYLLYWILSHQKGFSIQLKVIQQQSLLYLQYLQLLSFHYIYPQNYLLTNFLQRKIRVKHSFHYHLHMIYCLVAMYIFYIHKGQLDVVGYYSHSYIYRLYFNFQNPLIIKWQMQNSSSLCYHLFLIQLNNALISCNIHIKVSLAPFHLDLALF